MVEAGIETQVEVGVHDLAGDVAHGGVAHAGVVFPLGRREAAAFGEAQRRAVAVEEILLLESEPGVRIVENGGTGIGRMRSAVGLQDFVQNEHAIFLGGIGVNRDRFEHAVRAVACRLPGRAAVEAPVWKIFELGKAAEVFDKGLAAQVGHGGVSVEPEVFQFVLRHILIGVSIFERATPGLAAICCFLFSLMPLFGGKTFSRNDARFETGDFFERGRTSGLA